MEKKVNELNDIRKLATIASIEEIVPIEGADNIEHCRVRGWWVVVKKGEFSVGDLCVYVEVDSIMPDGLPEEKREEWRALNKQMSKVSEEERVVLREKMGEISKLNTRPEFEFLRAVKFHIKTRRILSKISQGICFPLSVLPSYGNISFYEGEDVTEQLGITQYIAPDPAVMGGDAKGQLQAIGCLVSDEERLENLSAKYERLREFSYYKTEKLEGTSSLFYIKNGNFGVCGRNVDYKTPDDEIPYDQMNVYWKVAKKLDIEEKMREAMKTLPLKNWAIQGEIIGEGIQGNIYKLKGQTIKLYNAFDIDTQSYLPYDEFIDLIVNKLGLETVPILATNVKLPEKSIELLEEADITYSVLNPKQLIEGFVFIANEIKPDTHITRSDYQRLSFKAKSRSYDIGKK